MHRMFSIDPLPKWQTGLAISVDFMIKGMKINLDFQCCDLYTVKNNKLIQLKLICNLSALKCCVKYAKKKKTFVV